MPSRTLTLHVDFPDDRWEAKSRETVPEDVVDIKASEARFVMTSIAVILGQRTKDRQQRRGRLKVVNS